MAEKMKEWVFGAIAVSTALFLIGGLAVLVLNAFAVLGALSAAALRFAGV